MLIAPEKRKIIFGVYLVWSSRASACLLIVVIRVFFETSGTSQVSKLVPLVLEGGVR